jgi:cellulose synthase/poly-beta-1,6-N-acetylglucosamine synthase-like glycosyltransferase
VSDGSLAAASMTLTVFFLLLVLLASIPILSNAFQLLTVPFHAWRNHYGRARPHTPRVAVIVPAWNEGNVIAASIERLMTLDYPEDSLRVYVVDDASTDDTPDVVLAKSALYPGRVVHLRRQVGGQGKAHTLNHGIRVVLGDDWMQATLIMDADVIYARDSLSKMTRHLADPEVGSVTAYIREGSADKTYLTRFIGIEYVLAQLAARRAQNVLGAMACLAGGAQLHSRVNLEDLGRMDTTTLAEDTVTTMETQLRGRRAVFEPHAVVLAEEPQLVEALWKQRVRWARGNFQVTARYRDVWFHPGRHRQLGSLSFGVQWFSVLLLPLAMIVAPIGFVGLFLLDEPLADLVFRSMWIGAACLYVFTVVFGLQLDPSISRTSWREAIAFPGIVSIMVMVTAFFPSLVESELPQLLGVQETERYRTGATLFIYAWISLTMLIAWLIKSIEHVSIGRWIAPALVYLIGYGPVLCAVTVDAFFKELRHADARWEKTEKIGRVLG